MKFCRRRKTATTTMAYLKSKISILICNPVATERTKIIRKFEKLKYTFSLTISTPKRRAYSNDWKIFFAMFSFWPIEAVYTWRPNYMIYMTLST